MTEDEFQAQQSEKENKKAQHQRNAQNNAQAIRVAAQVAQKSGNPYAMAAGKIVSAADTITGGKSSELVGHVMSRTQPKTVQKGINKAAESGALSAASKAASAKNGGQEVAKEAAKETGKEAAQKKAQDAAKKAQENANAKAQQEKEQIAKATQNSQSSKEPPKVSYILIIFLLLGIVILILPIILVAVILAPIMGSSNSNTEKIAYGTTCTHVTVIGENAGVYPLEDYIAGVIANEAYSDVGEEALKAQAIAARSFVIANTNNCTQSIENSDSKQTFNPNPWEKAKDAATSTSGLVLVSNGKVVSAMYDSFCYDDSDCPDAVCDDSGCTVEYTKLPNNEKHTIKLSSSKYRERIPRGQGHGFGMSQLVSYEMADNGSTYEEILKFFYSDGIEISKISSGAGLEEKNGFIARTSRATRDNQYFYGDGATNEGECAWYAVRRTNEILGTHGSEVRVSSGGNGGQFCSSSDYKQFTRTTNVDEVQPGDVLSWDNPGKSGHVAVVEAVYRDISGKVKSLDISHAYNNAGNGYNKYFSEIGITVNNDYLWQNNVWGSPESLKAREFMCESGNATGCQVFQNISRNQFEHIWSGYNIICAIHIVP